MFYWRKNEKRYTDIKPWANSFRISLLLIFSLCIVIYITNWNNSKENRKYREFQEKVRVHDLNNAEDLPNYITWGIKNKFYASGIGRDQKSYGPMSRFSTN